MDSKVERRKKKKKGGYNCCVPLCKTISGQGLGLYRIPSGTHPRRGRSTAVWAKYFHRIICRCRGLKNEAMLQRMLQGTLVICEKHFKEDDIYRSSRMSSIKFGRLPTLGFPDLCGEAVEIPPHWSKEIESSSDLAKETNDIKITTFESIIDAFGQCDVDRSNSWIMTVTGDRSVRFDYFQAPLVQRHEPSQSIEIFGIDSGFTFVHTIEGQSVRGLEYTIRGKSIGQFLAGLMKYRLCEGSRFVARPVSPVWREVNIPFVSCVVGRWVYEKRYLSDACQVAVIGKRQCQACVEARLRLRDAESDSSSGNSPQHNDGDS